MQEKSNSWQAARELMDEAIATKESGHLEMALNLANKAILLLDESGIDSFPLKVEREMLVIVGTKNPDFSGVIAVMKEASDFYIKEKNTLQGLDMIINLVGFLLNTRKKQEAIKYLDKAEKLLMFTTINDISRQLPKNRQKYSSSYLTNKHKEIQRIRKYIETL